MGRLLHLQVTNSKELFTFPFEQRKRRKKNIIQQQNSRTEEKAMTAWVKSSAEDL